jgi:hypothetical protein
LAPAHLRKLRASFGGSRRVSTGRPARAGRSTLSEAMSPTWIWMQIAIVVFVVIGMIVAITKLA